MNRCDAEGHCITCSDEAIPMRVVEILVDGSVAICEALDEAPAESGAAGTTAHVEVLIGLLDGVAPGDLVLVHAGAALARLEMEGTG